MTVKNDSAVTRVFATTLAFLLAQAACAFASDGETSVFWLMTMMQKGGIVMWPIFLCSVISVTIAIERSMSLRRSRVIKKDFLYDVNRLSIQGDIEKAIKLCKTQEVAISRIIQAGLLRAKFGVLEVERAIEAAGAREAALLEANLRGLGVIASLTPMLGLLGTVTGMIKSFSSIAEAGGQGTPGLVAAGISEALIATAAGLVVGIPSLAMYHYFRAKVDKLVNEMEEISLRFVEDTSHAFETAAKKNANTDGL